MYTVMHAVMMIAALGNNTIKLLLFILFMFTMILASVGEDEAKMLDKT